MAKVVRPENTVSPKVKAAGVGGAVATLLVYLAWVVFDFDLPPDVAVAVASLLVTAVATFAGYQKPDPLRQEKVVPGNGPRDAGESWVGFAVGVAAICVVLWFLLAVVAPAL